MFSFPPLPPWDGLHPSVIHFPIALIFVTPMFVMLALIWKKYTRAFLIAGTLMMLLAAGGALLATSTGSAAEDFAEKIPGAKAILEEHEELGEATRNFALVLASLLVIATGAFWRWEAKLPRPAILAAGILYLFANSAAILVAVNTAHAGGRLVHEVGVRARLSENPGALPAAPARSPEHADPKKAHD